MLCVNCRIRTPYDKAPELTHCVICGRELKADVRDVFECGKYGIIREKRETQIQMALAIENFLNTEKGTFLIEGGTGIGKSFAYLIPALIASQSRVIVSTAKKTLQDQLAEKDVPLLLKRMGLKNVKFSLYKGKSNYACWKLGREVPTQDRKRFDHFIEQAKGKGTPADVASWTGVIPHWWHKISIENCVLGNSCPHAAQCRPHPKADQIVITNHHLTAIDMKIAPGTLFGPYDLLILDEAHQAEEAFRSVNSRAITKRILDRIVSTVDNDMSLRSAIDDTGILTAKAVSKTLAGLRSTFLSTHDIALSHASANGMFDSTAIEAPLNDLAEQAEIAGGNVMTIVTALHRLYENAVDAGYDDIDSTSPEELMAMLGRTHRLHRSITSLSEFVTDLKRTSGTALPEDARLLTTCDDKGLYLKPIEIGPIIGPRFGTIKHKMILSATLAMGSDFSFVRKNLGLDLQSKANDPTPSPVVEHIYPSPFDLAKQAVLYIPRHLPLPAHAGMPDERHEWVSALTTEIAQLAGATRGDCFVLFSAKSDMAAVIEELGPFFWDDSGLNLVLHEGEATATLDQFRKTPNSVLFGLKSFWEGVDIAGDKLKLVIIPKLPFPNPSDPLVSALNDQAGDKAFFEVSIPRMTFDMKQGVGRLIRTQKDRGCVAILDPRIWTGTGNRSRHYERMRQIDNDPMKARMGYGKRLLDALGFTKITDDFTIFQKFANRFFNDV